MTTAASIILKNDLLFFSAVASEAATATPFVRSKKNSEYGTILLKVDVLKRNKVMMHRSCATKHVAYESKRRKKTNLNFSKYLFNLTNIFISDHDKHLLLAFICLVLFFYFN